VARTEVKSRVQVIRACSRTFVYDLGVRLFGLISCLGLAACAASIPRTVPRVVDGRVEDGPAVSPYAYEWFIEGERLAAQGRHDEAALAFEAAAAAPTGDVLLLMRLAEEYEMSGSSRRADRVLSVADRHYPTSPRVALAEGRIRLGRGNLEGAFDAFIEANRRAPQWAAPVVAMAEALASRGDAQRATAVLLEYLENSTPAQSDAALSELLSLARRHGDPETFARALEFAPGMTSETRSGRAAELALAAGQPALAARILGMERRTRHNTNLWLKALARSGDRAEAVRYLASDEAGRLASVEARAGELVQLGAGEQALGLLAAAEHSPNVQYTRGSALLYEGHYVEGAAALASVPSGTGAFESSRLALADCSAARGRRGAAIEALSLTPHDSLPVREKIAYLLVDSGELRTALRLFDPRQPDERAALASLFERIGRYEEAYAYYATVRVAPTSAPRLRARAAAEQLTAQGLRPSAIAILEQWASVAPEDLYSRVRLVDLLRADRRLDEARSRGWQALPMIDDPILRVRLMQLLGARAEGD
jgi:tetratricopeptide (TPR) repeat protein